MLILNTNINITNNDFNLYHCGMEQCAQGHSWGPGVRDHFLIHYVSSGKGSFFAGNTEYKLSKGYGFLICPGTITSYQADGNDPWCYFWLGFNGIKAESYLKMSNLTYENPIFLYDSDDFIKDCIHQMIMAKDLLKCKETRITGLLYMFMSKLIELKDKQTDHIDIINPKDEYAKRAANYIAMNYSRNLSVNDISRYLGLNRSYVYLIIKEKYNASPKEYITNYRITKACDLLENSSLSISEISRSVGYEDPLLFSKIFKKSKKIAPRDFRKNKNARHENGCEYM